MQFYNIKKAVLAGMVTLLAFGCQNESENPNPTPTDLRVKSVATTGSSWSATEDYTYYSNGHLAAINWKRQAPYETVGSEEFYYENDKLMLITKKINGLAPEEIRYNYQQDQIIATSSFVNGLKISYQLYEYDIEGRLDVVEFYTYNSAANGYDFSGEHRLTYFSDGNVKEIQKFDFLNGELIWNSTKSFNSYLEAKNPIDTELVLGIVIQRKLPAGYEVRYPTTTYPYHFTYQFRPDGYPSERKTTYNDGSSEVSLYTYE